MQKTDWLKILIAILTGIIAIMTEINHLGEQKIETEIQQLKR